MAAVLREVNPRAVFHDLYAEKFDPVLSEEEYRRKTSFDPAVQTQAVDLEAADRVVVVHPDWWGDPPAILKGWVDRVITTGVGYEYRGEDFGPQERIGLLEGKSVRVLVTSDGDGAGIEDFWRRVWEPCGVSDLAIRVFENVRESDEAIRARWLDEVGSLLRGGH